MSISIQKHLLNTPEDLVQDSLKGCALNPAVALDERHRVIYQRNPTSPVSLISGGGSGHEPAHASFVGSGILTAAVAGSIFASPNVSQIRRAIDIVSAGPGHRGTLIVVKNYTGDVLHFGLAAEQHRAAHRGSVGDFSNDVRFVIVGDDVAVGRTQGGIVGRRGLAGTILVYKIAGELAKRGASLDQVEALATFVSQNIATFGIGLEHCHVPGTEPAASHLAPDELELGMGIHNEPGFAHLKPYPPLKELVAQMLASITSTVESDPERGFLSPALKRDGKDEVVLLVNNLGAVSQLELGGVVKEAVSWLQQNNFVIRRVLSGTYMTSLNMPGFSLTVLLLPRSGDQSPFTAGEILDFLDAPTEAPGWPWHPRAEPSDLSDKSKVESAEDASPEVKLPILKPQKSDARSFASSITKAAEALIKAEPEITRQDTIAGDGDAGLTLKSGAQGILKAIKDGRIDGTNIISDVLAISAVVDEDMGGTSGALYSIFFSALATSLRSSAEDSISEVTFDIWAKGVSDALNVLYKYTRARPPSRTLVDPLSAFVQKLQHGTFADAVGAAHEAALATKHLKATAGRGAYVDQKTLAESDVPDPGAWGVWIILETLLSTVQL